MTKLTTTITFKHGALHAVEAALNALTIAIAYCPEGSDTQATLEKIRNDLRAAKKQVRRLTKTS